jgi:hypothetical protein
MRGFMRKVRLTAGLGINCAMKYGWHSISHELLHALKPTARWRRALQKVPANDGSI